MLSFPRLLARLFSEMWLCSVTQPKLLDLIGRGGTLHNAFDGKLSFKFSLISSIVKIILTSN